MKPPLYERGKGSSRTKETPLPQPEVSEHPSKEHMAEENQLVFHSIIKLATHSART